MHRFPVDVHEQRVVVLKTIIITRHKVHHQTKVSHARLHFTRGDNYELKCLECEKDKQETVRN